MILLIDNYDSFTYNLVQRLGEMDAHVNLRVVRNDKITLGEIAELSLWPARRGEKGRDQGPAISPTTWTR
jgi:hypothetical protein